MNLVPSLAFFATIGYFVIAAQGIVYRLAFAKAFGSLPAAVFVQLRQNIDVHIRAPLKAIYLGTPCLLLPLIGLELAGHRPLTAAFHALALLLLLADLRLVIKRSEPINQLVNNLNGPHQVEGTGQLQAAWIQGMLHRACFHLPGFVLLLIPCYFFGS